MTEDSSSTDQVYSAELEDPSAAAEYAFDATSEGLGSGADVDACVATVAKIGERYDATFSHLKKERVPIACKAGCSWCCHIRVELLPHEAIALFRYINTQLEPGERKATIERINANAKQIERLTDKQHRCTNIQCALLVNNRCSVYPARPMLCGGHHSLDVDACTEGFEKPTIEEDIIPLIDTLAVVRGMMMVATQEALDKLELDNQSIELHTALAALFRDPSLIGRWRGGRRLLKK